MRLTVLVFLSFFISVYAISQTSTFTDSRDGQTYKIKTFEFINSKGKKVKKTWMLENLRHKLDKGSYAIKSKVGNSEKEQVFYVESAIESACPAGWHIPDKEECMMLINKFGGQENAGLALKSTNYWGLSSKYSKKNNNGDNSSGMNILPTGKYRVDKQTVEGENREGLFWAQKEKGYIHRAVSVYYWGNRARHGTFSYDDKKAFCIRCVRDEVISDNVSSKKINDTPTLNPASGNKQFGSFTDSRDGQTYKTIKVKVKNNKGRLIEREWMAQNLNYTTAKSLEIKNLPKELDAGKLYSWKEAMTACPSGWHLPERKNWEALFNAFGGEKLAGKKLLNKRYGGTNSSGFNACIVGQDNPKRYMPSKGKAPYWTSSHPTTSTKLFYMAYVTSAKCYARSMLTNDFQGAVRCIRDIQGDAINSKNAKNIVSEINKYETKEAETKEAVTKNKKEPVIVPSYKLYTLTANDVEMKGNTIVRYKNNSEKNIIIPAKIGGVSVIKIGSRAFGKRNLTAVKLPNTLKTIGKKAFAKNPITEIVIPSSVTNIGNSAFWQDSLQKLTIPKSVKNIGPYAFYENYIKELNLPKTAKLEKAAFTSNKIEKLNGKSSLGFIYAQSGNGTINKSILNSYGGSSLVNVKIPNTVKVIGTDCFLGCGLESVTIPEGVREIRKGAFFVNKLKQIKIPESVSYIGYAAFQKNQLTSVNIPSKVTVINKLSFSDNKLTHITIGRNVKVIFDAAFDKNELKSLDGGESLKVIGHSAFAKNSFTALTIPNGVEAIGHQAFNSCKIKTLNIPKSVKFIEKTAFGNNLGITTINGKPSNGLLYGKLADGSFDKTHILTYVGEKGAMIVIPDEVERISELKQAEINKFPEKIDIIGKYYTYSRKLKLQMPNSEPNKQWKGYKYTLSEKEALTLKPGEYYTSKSKWHFFINPNKYTLVRIRFKVQGVKSKNDYVMLTFNNNKTEITRDQLRFIAPVKKGKVNYKAVMYHSSNGAKYTAQGVFDSNQKEITIILRK